MKKMFGNVLQQWTEFTGQGQANLYDRHRAIVPPILIERMITFLKEKYSQPLELAYDVGCGSGESSRVLTPYFKHVVGTDVNSEAIMEAEGKRGDQTCSQIEQAEGGWAHQNLTYQICPADLIPEKDNSVQMISASQAAHWFDLPKFYNEGQRVLSPGGVMCLYGHKCPTWRWSEDPSLNGELDQALTQLYATDLKGYWAAERDIVDNSYKNVTIPYTDFTRDDSCYHEMETNVSDLAKYCWIWTGHQNYVKQHGVRKGKKLIRKLQERVMSVLNVTTSPEETILTKRTSFFLLMGRKL